MVVTSLCPGRRQPAGARRSISVAAAAEEPRPRCCLAAALRCSAQRSTSHSGLCRLGQGQTICHTHMARGLSAPEPLLLRGGAGLGRPSGGGARLALQLPQQPLRDLHGGPAPAAQGVVNSSGQAGLGGRGHGAAGGSHPDARLERHVLLGIPTLSLTHGWLLGSAWRATALARVRQERGTVRSKGPCESNELGSLYPDQACLPEPSPSTAMPIERKLRGGVRAMHSTARKFGALPGLPMLLGNPTVLHSPLNC